MSKTAKKYSLLAWLICGLGAMFYSYEYLLRILPSVMEAPLTLHYNLTPTSFGLLSSFYYYAYVPMQIPVGILMDMYGPRRLLSLACLVCSCGAFLFAVTPYFWVAALGRFSVGLGSAFAFVGVLKLATLWLPQDKLALVAGLTAALGTVGAMIGDNFLGYMVIKLGWMSTVVFTAMFGFVLVVCLWFGLKDKKVRSQYPRKRRANNLVTSMEELKVISKNPQIWLAGLFGGLVYLPTTVFAELWGIPYLHHAHHLSQEASDLGNSIIFLGFTIGAPFMGWISDRLHRRKIPMALGAMGAFVMVCVLLYFPHMSVNSIYVSLFLLGFCYSVQAIVFVVSRENAPVAAAGTAMALTNMVVMLGGMIVQPLVGWFLAISASHRLHIPIAQLHDAQDQVTQLYTASDYQNALFMLPVGIFISIIITFFIRETNAKLQPTKRRR